MKKPILFTIILFILTGYTFAQKNKTSFWESLFQKKRFSIEFKQVNHNIVIPAHINNSDTLWFILDTGLGTSLITELTSKDSLTINYAKKIKLKGLGDNESIDAYSSFGNDIRIAGIHFKNQNINALLQDVFFLSRKSGCKINGIIGSTVFERYIVRINYSNNKIDFIKPEFYKHKKRKRDACLPLEFVNNKPYIRTWITDYKGNRTYVKLLIDTGASLAIWLQESDKIAIPEKKIYNIIGQGLNGNIFGHISRIKNIELGQYTVKEPVVSFPDSTSLKSREQNDHRNGSIGGDLLRRFNIIIDYPNKRICFRKNHMYKKEFVYNNSGIEIETPIPEIKYYLISSIMQDSPAYNAKLKEGDQIISINNKNAQELELKDIHEILSSTKREKIYIRVLRDRKKMSFIIITKKMI
ncbi:MAG: aspartyl protease family protein [Marinifilaceae bacterium]